MPNVVARIVSTVCFAVIGQGILTYLATKQIYPGQWIADLIGHAEVVIQGTSWTVIGLFGLLGFMLAPLLELGRRKLASWLDKKTPSQGISTTAVAARTSDDEALLKHDAWLLDALWYIAFRKWNTNREAVNLASQVQLISTARQEVMQLVADCDLKLWGKDAMWSSGPWREIPCEYWRTHKIEFWEPLKDDPESLRTEVNIGNPDEIYVALKTSKAQVERLWPKESHDSSLEWTDFRMTLVDLAKEAKNYGWEFATHELEIIDFRDGLRQAGVDGTIRIWGRMQHQFDELSRQEPLQEIEKGYWRRQNWIDPASWMRVDTRKGTFAGIVDDNFLTRTVTVTDSERYVDIHVDRAQALLWLRGAAKSFIGRNKPR